MTRERVKEYRINYALALYDTMDYSIKQIVSITGVSQGTLYRAVNKRKNQN